MKPMDLLLWLCCAALGAVPNCAFAGGPRVPQQPNIVVIVADDLGYGDLSCYGSKDIRTPRLDQLAKQGVRLTDAYANAAVCSPTRAALITGRYPQRSGFEYVIDYGQTDFGLSATKTSLPRLLKEGGYRTALFGKWHLGYKKEWGPNAHGFDEFFGFLAADLDYYSHREPPECRACTRTPSKLTKKVISPISLRNGPSLSSARTRKSRSFWK